MNLIQEDINTLCSSISGAKRIALCAHVKPDGDAIGSLVAARRFISSYFDADTRIVSSDAFPGTLAFIPTRTDIQNTIVYQKDPAGCESWIAGSNLIICLDCSGFSRTGSLSGILTSSKARKILIDHHLNPSREEFDLVFSSTGVSSASELLYSILKATPQTGGDFRKIPRRARYALMCGMTTDTNNLSNSVFPSTLAMCSELLEAGVDRDSILLHINNEYSESRLRTIGYLLSAKLTICSNGVAYMILKKEESEMLKIKEGELEGIVNMPLAAKNVRMSIFLREDEGHFRVSIRSKKGTSANLCAMSYFNGGGHEQASGGKLYFPGDIPDRESAAGYIESVCSKMFGK